MRESGAKCKEYVRKVLKVKYKCHFNTYQRSYFERPFLGKKSIFSYANSLFNFVNTSRHKKFNFMLEHLLTNNNWWKPKGYRETKSKADRPKEYTWTKIIKRRVVDTEKGWGVILVRLGHLKSTLAVIKKVILLDCWRHYSCPTIFFENWCVYQKSD